MFITVIINIQITGNKDQITFPEPKQQLEILNQGSVENSRKWTNAIGLNGKPIKCRTCESILHLMRHCPRRNENENENFTLFTCD